MRVERIVVIGGGCSGLAAAYDLAREGFQVTVLEAAQDFGGLASSFRLEGIPVERFYHFICRPDSHLLALVDELGLSHKVYWYNARTDFFHHGRRFRFSSPFDLLGFSAIPNLDRLRFALHALHAKHRTSWRHLDRIPARDWLIEWVGEQAYDVIWRPLLKVKFGEEHDKISAAWMWHRIWRVANSRRGALHPELYGCLEYGTATLVDRLVEWLRARPNVTIRCSARVDPLSVVNGRVREVRAGGEVFPCDAVISTVALPTLGRLLPDQNQPYFSNVRSVRYLGVVCALFSLKREFSGTFWTNVNDPSISFNGIIEQTALNRNLRERGLNVIYLPAYLPTTSPRYTTPDDELIAEYRSRLKLVNPSFDDSWVKEVHVFRSPYTQPVFTTNFLDLVPAHRTPVTGLYVTDSTQFYPEDRTISAAIHQGRTVARLIREELNERRVGHAALDAGTPGRMTEVVSGPGREQGAITP